MDKIEFSIEEIAAMVRAVFPKAMQDRAELAVYTAVRQAEAKSFDRGVRSAPAVSERRLDEAFREGQADGYQDGYEDGLVAGGVDL